MKSVFDEDCDCLRARIRRLEARRQKGMPVPDHIPVDWQVLELLLEDHYDLKKKEEQR